jgi:hypothetical protein
MDSTSGSERLKISQSESPENKNPLPLRIFYQRTQLDQEEE